MTGLLISLVAAFGFALLHERAQAVGCKLVLFSTSFLPRSIADARRDQWLADVHEVEGGAWKLITAAGIAWTCRAAIIEGLTGIELKKKYIVVLYPTENKPVTVMFHTKHVDPCGLIVLSAMCTTLAKIIGKDKVLKMLDEFISERASGKTKVQDGDAAFRTHVPPLNLDLLIEVVDGTPHIRRVR